MKTKRYLLDTHTLIFWYLQKSISKELLSFLDKQSDSGHLMISSISFWEIALLVKVKKISLPNIQTWQSQIINNAPLQVLNPSIEDMVDSTLLPTHHKDPFDRLLITQTKKAKATTMITKDKLIQKYKVETMWM